MDELVRTAKIEKTDQTPAAPAPGARGHPQCDACSAHQWPGPDAEPGPRADACAEQVRSARLITGRRTLRPPPRFISAAFKELQELRLIDDGHAESFRLGELRARLGSCDHVAGLL